MTLNRDELYAQQEEILLRIALTDLALEEARVLEGELLDEPPDRGAIRALERALHRRRLRMVVWHTLPRVAHVAGALLLVAYLALTALLAVSDDARRAFASCVLNVTPSVGSSGHAPAGWTEKYYPEYIPPGWTLDTFDPAFGDVVYRLDRDHIFQFGVYALDASININTDGAQVCHVRVGSAMATAAENAAKGYTWLTWSTGDRQVVIYIDAGLETALHIATGVREVEGYGN